VYLLDQAKTNPFEMQF
jgi:hypothetical protein